MEISMIIVNIIRKTSRNIHCQHFARREENWSTEADFCCWKLSILQELKSAKYPFSALITLKLGTTGPLKNTIAMTGQWHETRFSVSGHGQTSLRSATPRGEFELFQQPHSLFLTREDDDRRVCLELLREEGMLVEFYNAFIRNAHDDPSGYETLKNILNESDMADFKKRWAKWVLKLRFG